MTRSIRKNNIPQNLILFTGLSSVPSKFIIESNNDKMPRNTASGVNPGSEITTAAHQHATSGTHEHDGNVSHAHHAQTDTYTGSDGHGSYNGSAGIHYHEYDTNATTVNLDTAAGGDHQHDATATADPPYYTYLAIKKTSVYNLRSSHQIPHKACLMWKSSSLHTGYAADTTGNDKFFKFTNTPGQTGGESTHTHSEVAGHNHTFTLASHTHALPSATGPGSNNTAKIGSGSATVTVGGGHTHGLSGTTISSDTATGSTGTSDAHSEIAIARDPAWFKVRVARRDIVSMRKPGIPKSGICMWKNTLASIPTGFVLTDGNNGTTNWLNKFPKIGNSASSTGGSDTHQHASQNHTHTLTAHHTHTISGNTDSGGSGGNPGAAGATAGTRLGEHVHGPGDIMTTTFDPAVTSSTGHQHAAATSLPNYIQVAYIERTS